MNSREIYLTYSFYYWFAFCCTCFLPRWKRCIWCMSHHVTHMITRMQQCHVMQWCCDLPRKYLHGHRFRTQISSICSGLFQRHQFGYRILKWKYGGIDRSYIFLLTNKYLFIINTYECVMRMKSCSRQSMIDKSWDRTCQWQSNKLTIACDWR